MMGVKCLEQCLAQGKHVTSVSHYYDVMLLERFVLNLQPNSVVGWMKELILALSLMFRYFCNKDVCSEIACII